MNESRFLNRVHIYISENYELYAFVQLLKEIDCKEYNYGVGFFGAALGYFVCDGIRVELMYDNMIGTVLSVPDSISDSDLAKFRQWAARMYELSQDERYKV